MTVNHNAELFCGKVVADYNPETGISDPAGIAYRIRISYDESETDITVESKIDFFSMDPKAAEVTELIIGSFDFGSSNSSAGIVSKLVELKDRLPKLQNLFIGDITYEENEMSWIQQSDVSPLLEAFPGLLHFQVRGGNGLSLGKLTHNNLQTLIVETGGMPANVIREVCYATLPNLQKLELWLGTDDYGFESTVDDLDPLLSDKLFPKLKVLGLRNSSISDQIAKKLIGAPVMNIIEVLDLSMGTLGDEGGQALLDNPAVKNLKSLDLVHHYMSDGMMAKLDALGIAVNMDEREQEDEYDGESYRYVEVGE
jgi:hypothetical protein